MSAAAASCVNGPRGVPWGPRVPPSVNVATFFRLISTSFCPLIPGAASADTERAAFFLSADSSGSPGMDRLFSRQGRIPVNYLAEDQFLGSGSGHIRRTAHHTHPKTSTSLRREMAHSQGRRSECRRVMGQRRPTRVCCASERAPRNQREGNRIR
jgi:hypothetical protein